MRLWPDIIGDLPWQGTWTATTFWTNLGLLIAILANLLGKRFQARRRLKRVACRSMRPRPRYNPVPCG